MCVDGGCGRFTDVNDNVLPDQEAAKEAFESKSSEEQERLRKEHHEYLMGKGPIDFLEVLARSAMNDCLNTSLGIGKDIILRAVDETKDMNPLATMVVIREVINLMIKEYKEEKPHPLNDAIEKAITEIMNEVDTKVG